MQARVSQEMLIKQFGRTVTAALEAGITEASRWHLEIGSKTYGRAYRIWLAHENYEAGLRGAMIYSFRIYDDDGELYYTGRMITDENPPGDEACGGPLDDFGRPNAGATEIRYLGHPEMNIG